MSVVTALGAMNPVLAEYRLRGKPVWVSDVTLCVLDRVLTCARMPQAEYADRGECLATEWGAIEYFSPTRGEDEIRENSTSSPFRRIFARVRCSQEYEA